MKYVVSPVPYNKITDYPRDGQKLYYVHMEGFPNIPVFGSFGSKEKANKICRIYNKGRTYRRK